MFASVHHTLRYQNTLQSIIIMYYVIVYLSKLVHRHGNRERQVLDSKWYNSLCCFKSEKVGAKITKYLIDQNIKYYKASSKLILSLFYRFTCEKFSRCGMICLLVFIQG